MRNCQPSYRNHTLLILKYDKNKVYLFIIMHVSYLVSNVKPSHYALRVSLEEHA